MICILQNVIQSRKIYVKVVKICNDLGLKDLLQLSKKINLCGRSHFQIMLNARSITERQDLFTIFILFSDNLKNISGLLVWYLHKESIKKKSSKTNCGLDIRAPVNILPIYRDFYIITDMAHSSISLSAGSSLRRGFSCRPIISFIFRAEASLTGAWKSQLNFGLTAAAFWNSSEWAGRVEGEGGMEGNYAEVQERINCAENKKNMQQHLEIDWKKATTKSASGGEKTRPRLPRIWKDLETRESSIKKKKKSPWLWPGSEHSWVGFLTQKSLYLRTLSVVKSTQEGSQKSSKFLW